MLDKIGPRGALVAGVLAAIGASACCVLPLVLLTIGIGGAWLASLAALEPLQPIFLLVAVASFAFAYRRLYRAEPGCAPGDACVVPQVRRRQRTVFWLASMVVASLVTFPWYAGLLY